MEQIALPQGLQLSLDEVYLHQIRILIFEQEQSLLT